MPYLVAKLLRVTGLRGGLSLGLVTIGVLFLVDNIPSAKIRHVFP
jgi:hypothetical protein